MTGADVESLRTIAPRYEELVRQELVELPPFSSRPSRLTAWRMVAVLRALEGLLCGETHDDPGHARQVQIALDHDLDSVYDKPIREWAVRRSTRRIS